jgi:hypothetical protein
MEIKEWTVIQHTARANNFPYTLAQKLDTQLQYTLNSHDKDNDTTKSMKTGRRLYTVTH